MSNIPQKNRKNFPLTTLILYAVAIYMIYRIPWSDMNSFHFLILFMFILCLMLKFSNARKAKIREFAMRRKQAEEEAARAQQAALLAEDAQETSAESPEINEPTDAPVEAAEISKPADAPTEAAELSEPEEKTTI